MVNVCDSKFVKLFVSSAVAIFATNPAFAQQNIDEPDLSPMFFGDTKEEREQKISEEEELQEEARLISLTQEQDGQNLEEPRLRPLLFGPSLDDVADDLTGGRITLGEEDENRGFFGALTFLVPEETNLSIGLGPVYEPDYFGSNDYEINPDPQFYIRFKNFVFLDDGGADFTLFGFDTFRMGPTFRVQRRRKERDNPALQGLGDVGRTFEVGAFAATTFLDRFAFKAKARHGIKTGHRGTVVDGYLTALIFRSNFLSLSATGQATWVGERYADTYFSVTPAQSIASQNVLSVYDAGSGIRDVGGSVTAYINIRDRWSLNPYATYTYIFNDFADSPIINDFGDQYQFKVGFHLMREFSFSMK